MANNIICDECKQPIEEYKEWHFSIDPPEHVQLKNYGYYDFCSEKCLKDFMGTGKYNER